MSTNLGTDQIPTTTIRPSRSVYLAQLVTSLMLVVLAISGWVLDIRFLPVGLIMLAILGLWSSLRSLMAEVRVSPDGLAFRRRNIAWIDIFQFSVVKRPWVRYVVVEELGAGDPKPYRLPAPVSSQIFADPAFDRDIARLRAWTGLKNHDAAAPTQIGFGTRTAGFIMVAIFILVTGFFDRPLGWVSGAQASTTPSACAALNGTLTSKLGASGMTEVPTIEPMSTGCSWSVPSGGLDVTFRRFVRHGLHSGSDGAQYQERIDRFGIRGVTGTAGSVFQRPGERTVAGVPGQVLVYPGGSLESLIRKGNVLVDVQLNASGLDAASTNTMKVVVNAALDAVTLS